MDEVRPKGRRSYLFMKRLTDIIVSVIALAIIGLPMLVICIWIKATSEGPIFFRQARSGLHKESFNILKFRTMYVEAPSYIATRDLKGADDYITPIGSFLRRTSIDELPQLFNVIKGDMSLVGPRPVINQESDLIQSRERYGANDVLPGLTGWAQINGRDGVAVEEKARLDGYYVENMSMWLDIKILFLTAMKVIKREGIFEGSAEQPSVKETEDRTADNG